LISWRYHLVSIVAVFLALALGVLAGTAVGNQGLAHTLKVRTDQLNKDVAAQDLVITSLRGQSADLTTFADQAMKVIVNARLNSVAPIVLVADDGASPAALKEVQLALSQGGANVVTTLSPLSKLTSTNPVDTKLLANIVGAPPQTSSAQILGLVAQTLAERLARGPVAPAHPGQADVLASLLNDGFIDSSDLSVRSAADIGIPGAVVVLSGSTEGAVTPPAAFMVPLVQALSAANVVVGAGEGRASSNGFVALVRQAGAVTGPLVTVDDLESADGHESSLGGTALVVGLQRAIQQGTGGDYGTAAGQLLPPLT
jgi:hypothetical protein